jgi:hypothetical protein
MATTTNPFLNIRAQAGADTKSANWYQEQVKSLSGLSPNKLMKNTPDLTTQVLPGRMYFFFYDAKHKDTLPYWDKFPLVLPFKKVPDGFLGINLHYLPYPIRFKLLGSLHNLAADTTISENNRLRMSWQILDSSSKYAPVKACVKHYLYSHVQTRFLNIKYPDWVTASQLPVERFVGASKTQVWRDSRKKY